MNNLLPKIIAAHDISGLGTASLRAVMPILSAMGCYVCPLPTAVLSTITGVYDGYQITDLTEQMEKTIEHWSTLNTKFDYIYSGFLGSPRQVDIIADAASRFGSYLVVDPVFADDGKLYSTMNDEMVRNMRYLTSKAKIITPNFTEAQFLLNEFHENVTEDIINDMLKRLCGTGPEMTAITSVPIDGGMHVCAMDSKTNEYINIKCSYINASCHGTGDVFTSVMLGAMASGESFKTALKKAAEFVTEAIRITVGNNIPLREGIAIEELLCDFRT